MITYDEATDLCPLCGCYWEHDFVECARAHGFTVNADGKNSIPAWVMGMTEMDYVERSLIARWIDTQLDLPPYESPYLCSLCGADSYPTPALRLVDDWHICPPCLERYREEKR